MSSLSAILAVCLTSRFNTLTFEGPWYLIEGMAFKGYLPLS